MAHLEQSPETLTIEQTSLELGTEGLKARLARTLGRAGLADNEFIQRSIALGLDLHADDRRSREPYNNHILRVVLRILEELEITDVPTVAAGALHDSIEDHEVELIEQFLDREAPEDPWLRRELGCEALRVFCAPYRFVDTPNLVLAVSNPVLRPGEMKNDVYFDHTGQLGRYGDRRAVAVKSGADWPDNTWVHPGAEAPEKRHGLDIKQLPIYPLHEIAINRPDSLIVGEPRKKLLATLATRRMQAQRRLGLDSDIRF